VVALGRYRPPLSVGIRNFKYSGRSDLAGPFSRALWQHAGNAFDQGVIFVPVPLHPKRLCERGYNQAALLARGLARWASSTTSVTALRRTTHTAKQARLTRAEREHNVQHTMQASPGCGQQRIVLVDDVLTTGATLVECVRALHDAGARVAGACVLAVAGQDQDADA
jgi:ComF family protein